MRPSELSERWLHFSGWLIKAGYVVQIGGYYRITDAGRMACPFRNPLAATVAAPVRMEIQAMKTEKIVTRQEVLAAIVGAGPSGTTCKQLIEQFACGDQVIYNHVSLLSKQAIPVIFKPEKGRIVAIQFNDRQPAFATPVTPKEKAVVEAKTQHAAPRAEELMPAMPELAVREETIEIKDIGERRGPIILHDSSEVDFGMFRSGRLEIYLDGKSILVLGDEVVGALQRFLGLFQEAA